MDLKTHLELNEIEKLLEAAPTLRDKLIIRFLFRTGCRVSELITLPTANIDWDRQFVLIHHLKRTSKKVCSGCGAKIGRKHHFCPSCATDVSDIEGTGNEVRQRLISIDKETLAMAREYLDRRSVKSDRLIPLTRQMVFYIIQDAATRVGLGGKILINPDTGKARGISPHKFRDFVAIRWLEKQGDISGQKALQEYLGHQSFNTTARYLKLSPTRVQKVYDEVWKDA